jgi:hypothetical protein
MIESNDEAEKYVKDTYGLDLKFHSGESTFIADGKHEPYDLKPVEGGDYKIWDLIDSSGIIYRLIGLPKVQLITEEELIKRLENDNLALNVKAWEKLTPETNDTDFAFYKLVPFTVQGVPHY